MIFEHYQVRKTIFSLKYTDFARILRCHSRLDPIQPKQVTLLILETKTDDSFPSGQFKMCRFSMPYKYDRDSVGGGLSFNI